MLDFREPFVACRAWTVALLLAATMVAWDFHGAVAGEPPVTATQDLQVEFRDGRLTLQAQDVPLNDVLRAIGENAGFDVVAKGDHSALVSRSFSALALEEGLRRLLGGTSFVMFYGGTGDPDRLVLLRDDTGVDSGSREMLLSEATIVDEPSQPEIDEPSQAEIEKWISSRLTHVDRGVRIVAVRRLTRLEPDVAVALAAEVLDRDDDPVVRGQVVAALGKIGGDRAAALLDLVLADEETSVRVQAVRALGVLGGDLAAHSLGRTLSDDADQEVRLMAIDALAGNASVASRSYLQAANAQRDSKIREAARQALDRWSHAGPAVSSVESAGQATRNDGMEYRGNRLVK